jgi:hypothetical protein
VSKKDVTVGLFVFQVIKDLEVLKKEAEIIIVYYTQPGETKQNKKRDILKCSKTLLLFIFPYRNCVSTNIDGH